MGAIMFFIMFTALIPVGVVILDILCRLGIVTDLEDPAEWDAPKEEEYVESKLPQIVLLPQQSKKKAM